MSDSVEKLKALEQEYTKARSVLLGNALTAEQQKTLGEMDTKLDDLRKRRGAEEKRAGGGGGIVSLASATDDEDVAKAFNSLMPAEKFKLYETDRPEWKRGLDAQERVGTRRLLGQY